MQKSIHYVSFALEPQQKSGPKNVIPYMPEVKRSYLSGLIAGMTTKKKSSSRSVAVRRRR
jgi:hypothetical protein